VRFIGIDPSTKTGFCALDENGQVLKAKELTGIGSEDPKRMVTLINEIVAHVQPNDFIVIEGFPYDTQRAMFASGLHHGIRNELFKRNFHYYEVAPNAVKKFVNVSGWTGEKGSKQRLEGKEKKKAVMAAVFEKYGFESKSDNVVDAFIMAQIAKGIWEEKNGVHHLLLNQSEVIQQILNPPEKVKKSRKKKSKL
jgi:crossover junction endodeoxyribonuclease RuvC